MTSKQIIKVSQLGSAKQEFISSVLEVYIQCLLCLTQWEANYVNAHQYTLA